MPGGDPARGACVDSEDLLCQLWRPLQRGCSVRCERPSRVDQEVPGQRGRGVHGDRLRRRGIWRPGRLRPCKELIAHRSNVSFNEKAGQAQG